MLNEDRNIISELSEAESRANTSKVDKEELLLQYGDLQGIELLREMITHVFPGRIALVSSFGAHSAILLDMVSLIDKRTQIIFLDTGKLFDETLSYQESLVPRLGLENVQKLQPAQIDIEKHDPSGDLWSSDSDRCCHIRKVRPLQDSIINFDCWITGRKRYQGGLRSDLKTIEFVDEATKINPLALWSTTMVEEYFERRELPYHPLFQHGYLSLGCVPCTRPVDKNGNERDGRWSNSDRAECGIHGNDLRKSDY